MTTGKSREVLASEYDPRTANTGAPFSPREVEINGIALSIFIRSADDGLTRPRRLE
jgi:hypothetical protein